MSKNHSNKPKPVEQKAPEVKEQEHVIEVPEKDVVTSENPPEHLESNELVNDSIQSHSAQVTEGDAAQARVENKDDEEVALDPQDGARLDQNAEGSEFDHKKEEKLAYAEPEEQPEAVKHAIVNPNGIGSEWPRG